MAKIVQTEWDLDALLPPYKSEAHSAFIADIDARVAAILEKKPILTNTISIQQFQSLMKDFDELDTRLQKLSAHAFFVYAKNVKDAQAKAYVAFVEERAAKLTNQLIFFELWFIRLPQEKAMQLADSLGPDAHSLRKKYEHGRHVLSEAEEKLINIKDITGADALTKLYNTVVSGFQFKFEGKQQSLTQISRYMQQPDREKRKKVDALMEAKFREYEDVLGDIYVTLVKDFNAENVDLRKYATPLSVRTRSEEISEVAVHALLDAVRAKKDIFHRYFALRAKILGFKQLETYDLIAPIYKEKASKVSYGQAMRKVLDAIETISPRFREQVEGLVAARHIDSVFHQHKMGGAFNYGLCHGQLPYVFMQYLGMRGDMFTIVHELGHSVHSMHMNKYSSFSADAPIGICESVSTFFEEILFNQELQSASPEKKISLLTWKLSDLYGSVSNGAYVSYFEVRAHDLVNNGATHQDLTKEWTALKKEQLGPHVHTRDTLIGWLGIPHIYEAPFYYYNYAVGNLVALLFLKQFRSDPVAFRQRFERYLSTGGTLGTVETLKIMGIDVEDTKTWQEAFDVLQDYVVELERLVSI